MSEPTDGERSALVRTKAELRTSMRERVRGLTTAERAERSAAVVTRLAASERVSAAKQIVAYRALGTEVDPAAFVEASLLVGREVYAPVVVGDDLELHRVSPATVWRRGAAGNAEPTGGAVLDPRSPSDLVVLVPGLAFDRTGARLGRGGGHYDRLLARLRERASPLVVGLAFDLQIVDEVPTEPHDARVEALATESSLEGVSPRSRA